MTLLRSTMCPQWIEFYFIPSYNYSIFKSPCTAAFLSQLREREKELKLEPDYAVDSYLKATSVQGKRQNAVTDFVIRVLGLEVRQPSIYLCPTCNVAIALTCNLSICVTALEQDCLVIFRRAVPCLAFLSNA